MASNEEANTNIPPVVDDDFDCFDFSFLFEDDVRYDDQSLPADTTTTIMTSAEPILDTNMPCMDVIPAAFDHQDTVGSSNKRTRGDEHEAVSTLKRFKPTVTLENPNHLLHQETLYTNHLLHQETLNPIPSQPYIVNNATGGVPSGYTVGGFGPTRVDEEEAISNLKRFKPLETGLENPYYLLHQETLQNPYHLLHQETLNPMPSQPYIVNNVAGGIPSGYTVGGFGPTRVDEEESISTLKHFTPLETLETLNPNHLLHQETLNPNHLLHQETLNPLPSQPYIANNVTGAVSSGYTVGGFGSTNMAIFGGSRRKTPSPWTVEEHVRFLIGIDRGYKGDWKTISRDYVRTRTAAQVTSHAQKHFLHQQKRNDSSNVNGSANPSSMMWRRKSIYDIAYLSDVEISKYAEALRYLRSPINH